MKKYPALILCVLMLFSGIVPAFAASYSAMDANAKSQEGVVGSAGGVSLNKNAWLMFSGVSMTGVKSVTLNVKSCQMPYGNNGDAFAVMADAKNGTCLGYVVTNDEAKKSFTGNIREISGTHDIYIVSSYGTKDIYVVIESVTFNTDPAPESEIKPVPDEKIVDNYHDTWALTDSLGRRAADYAEAGDVKEGDHYVGMMYWNWQVNPTGTPVTIADVIKAHPDEKENYMGPSWANTICYWSVPALGYYSSSDYFVYRKHAEWLANAGVDVLFYDYTNLELTYVKTQRLMMQAFHDAREAGVNAPKLSAFIFNPKYEVTDVKALWFNLYNDPAYADLLFYWEGKPLLVAGGRTDVDQYLDKSNPEEVRLIDEIFGAINVRKHGSRANGADPTSVTPEWQWLENYPLHEWGKKRDDGRVEMLAVGCSINHSYVYGHSAVGLASDPYTKGRGYSEAFGEDYSPEGARSGTFFREQTSQALSTDPAFCYIDGWNEWTAIRQREYNGYPNSFVDTYDDENSRDVEPSGGALKDDYYCMAVDFIRRYKGVRPAPTAPGAITIDLSGDVSQWDGVTPEYICDTADYDRNEPSNGSGDITYTAGATNVITRAKAAYDDANVYFMVKTKDAIKKDAPEFLHLYINTDRKYVTGWEGYELAVNRTTGAIERFDGSWQKVGEASPVISGNTMQLAVPREYIPAIDFEFKWVDSAGEIASGDLMDFYRTGSVAPMGRFNYLYTEKAQTTLSAKERKELSGTTVFKAGAKEMITSGERKEVYEKNADITPIEKNGTLYIPAESLIDVVYGESKFEYDAAKNIARVKMFRLQGGEITDYTWIYTTPGSSEVRRNGILMSVSAPVIAENGRVYLPLTLLSECFGFTLGINDGVYAVSRNGAVPAAAFAAATYLD